MRIIISPAKKMNADTDNFAVEALPQFLADTKQLTEAMQAKLAMGDAKALYAFWGGRLAEQLAAETDWVLNLASKEYSRAVEPHLPPRVRFVTCTFGERKDGKVVEKGTMCKMARGQMVRWLAENRAANRADIRSFDQLGYRFQEELSTENHDVFLKDEDPPA